VICFSIGAKSTKEEIKNLTVKTAGGKFPKIRRQVFHYQAHLIAVRSCLEKTSL
jgi:hypothetical protein